MSKFYIVIYLVLLISCGAPHEVYKFQSEQMGKQYQYMHKITNTVEKKPVKSIMFSSSNTDHYFNSDKSDHHEISFTYTKGYDIQSIGISAYYYGGIRQIEKYIVDQYYSEKLPYHGYGLRFEFIFFRTIENFTIRFLNFQGGVNYETGDYFKWREKMSNKYEDNIVKNYNEDPFTLSVHTAPELQFHLDQDKDIGVFIGLGLYKNSGSQPNYDTLFGLNGRYKSFGLSITQSNMFYEHTKFIEENNSFIEKEVTKTQTRFNLSYLF